MQYSPLFWLTATKLWERDSGKACSHSGLGFKHVWVKNFLPCDDSHALGHFARHVKTVNGAKLSIFWATQVFKLNPTFIPKFTFCQIYLNPIFSKIYLLPNLSQSHFFQNLSYAKFISIPFFPKFSFCQILSQPHFMPKFISIPLLPNAFARSCVNQRSGRLFQKTTPG